MMPLTDTSARSPSSRYDYFNNSNNDAGMFLANKLHSFKKLFKAAHLNVQSLSCHIDELRAIFRFQDFNIIGISESFLKPSISSNFVALPGYNLFRNDRLNKACGGVAIYVKDGIKTKVLITSKQEYCSRPEFMLLELSLSSTDKLLVGICYRPPKIGHFTDFENALLSLMPCYNRILVMGDMNTDLNMTNRNFDYFQLTTIFQCLNMTILPLDPTHHTNESDTLIDLLIVSDPNEVVQAGQISVPAISRHDLIYCVLSHKIPKPEQKIITYRDFKNFDEAAFLTDVAQTPWHQIEALPSVDDMVKTFENWTLTLYDKHAPYVTRRINRKRRVPWMTEDILKMMGRRDKAHRKFKKTFDLDSLIEYRSLRNRVKQELRNSKIRYLNSFMTNNRQDSKSLWQGIKEFGLGKEKSNPQIDLPLNNINDHFVSHSNQRDEVVIANHIDDLEEQVTNLDLPITDQFHFHPISEEDTFRAIQRIHSNATGVDKIPIKFIKKMLFAVLPTITYIFNKSLEEGIFPENWKFALVRPLNKVPSPNKVEDFRPISILPALSKVLERLIHAQVVKFLDNNSKLHNFQSGFRKFHSTETALLRVTDDIRLAMDQRKCTILTLFDFSKAFDTVDHTVLLNKLAILGFSHNSLVWFKSYLLGRKQCVSVGDKKSTWKNVMHGVPQGSILGPLLFTLYANDLSSIIKFSSFHTYADDLQIYLSCPITKINETVGIMNQDINSIVEWTKKNGLKLNPIKTQPIIIGYSRLINNIDLESIHKISVDGNDIPYCSSVKNLGIIMNNTLDWSEQVNKTCKKVFSAMHALKKMHDILPRNIKLLLVQSLIFPHLMYCNSVLNDMQVTLNDKLQRCQNYCLRFVYSLQRHDHITPAHIASSTLKLPDQRLFRIVKLVRDILIYGNPNYFKDDFKFVSEGRRIDASHTRTGESTLRIPNHRTTIFTKSFLVSACRAWNALPVSIRSIESRASFILTLKKHLLEQMTETVRP